VSGPPRPVASPSITDDDTSEVDRRGDRRLERVVDESITTRSRIGYFAALYRQVTVAVRDAIHAGEFDDGPRMDAFDTAFGNRYLDALARVAIGREAAEELEAGVHRRGRGQPPDRAAPPARHQRPHQPRPRRRRGHGRAGARDLRSEG